MRLKRYALLPAMALIQSCGQPAVTAGNVDNGAVEAGPAGNALASVSPPFSYHGLCEASAAAVLDGDHFVVASDESETFLVYRRDNAQPVGRVARTGVTDIEGAARIGGRIFWLTSHSLNRDRVDKPKRKHLFASTVAAGPTLTFDSGSFIDLRNRVAALLGIDEEALKPWLNIEGLAEAQGGNLLLGLRGAPEGEQRALVLRVDNPLAPAAANGTNAARVWRLDLGGRGIRSLERVGEGARTYLILAGPRTDEHAISFLLYWWDGESETVTPGPVVPFGDMTPEALVAWPDGQIQILGDNGGDDASDPARCQEEGDSRPVRFPSLTVRLQPTAPSTSGG